MKHEYVVCSNTDDNDECGEMSWAEIRNMENIIVNDECDWYAHHNIDDGGDGQEKASQMPCHIEEDDDDHLSHGEHILIHQSRRFLYRVAFGCRYNFYLVRLKFLRAFKLLVSKFK